MKAHALTCVSVLAAIAMAAGGCSREPAPGYTRSALPRTCDPARFGAATARFEQIAADRNAILARLQAVPKDEAVHYLRELERERAAMRELSSEAQKVEVPRCLHSAKEIFGHYIEQSLANMDLLRPDGDAAAYRFASETTEGIRSQYQNEVSQQARNQQ